MGCKELCDETADCLSFVVDQNGGNKCHLKNECVDLSASCVDGGGWDFINYYPSRTCSGSHMIAMGKHSHNDWTDDHPTSICTDDSSHSAAYSNDYFGYDIAVGAAMRMTLAMFMVTVPTAVHIQRPWMKLLHCAILTECGCALRKRFWMRSRAELAVNMIERTFGRPPSAELIGKILLFCRTM